MLLTTLYQFFLFLPVIAGAILFIITFGFPSFICMILFFGTIYLSFSIGLHLREKAKEIERIEEEKEKQEREMEEQRRMEMEARWRAYEESKKASNFKT